MITSSGEIVTLTVAAVLTIAGLLCQVLVCMLVRDESKKVRRLSAQSPATAKSEWRADPKAVLSGCGVSSDSLTGQHVILASQAFSARNPPSASDLLAVTEDATRSRIIHTLPNALLSILLILGLAGTIWILSHVLHGDQFQRIIDKDANLSTEQLQSAVKEIYGGFGDAFIFSLCGIGGTIVLVLSRAFFVRPSELRFYAELQAFTIVNLQPAFQRDELTMPEALQRAAHSSEVTAEKFAECVKQLSGTLENAAGATATLGENVAKLSSFASTMREAAEALEGATEALQESFSEGGRLTRVFSDQEKSSSLLREAVQTASGKLTTHSTQVGNVQQRLEDISKLIETDIKANDREREKNDEDRQKLLSAIRDSAEELAKAIANQLRAHLTDRELKPGRLTARLPLVPRKLTTGLSPVDDGINGGSERKFRSPGLLPKPRIAPQKGPLGPPWNHTDDTAKPGRRHRWIPSFLDWRRLQKIDK